MRLKNIENCVKKIEISGYCFYFYLGSFLVKWFRAMKYPGLSMNILCTGDKSLVQRGFFKNGQAIHCPP